MASNSNAKTKWDGMSYSQLETELRKLGLKVTGTKAIKVDRLSSPQRSDLRQEGDWKPASYQNGTNHENVYARCKSGELFRTASGLVPIQYKTNGRIYFPKVDNVTLVRDEEPSSSNMTTSKKRKTTASAYNASSSGERKKTRGAVSSRPIFAPGMEVKQEEQQRSKRALVIGNNKYSRKYMPKLKNAVNDAIAMEHALVRIGFVVSRHLDIENERDMLRVLNGFLQQLNENDEAVFFFAGHGATSKEGHSALYGTRSGSLDVGILTDTIRTKNCHVFGIILDCCRREGRRGPSAGLSPMCIVPLANTFIAYGCAQGETSSDNTNGGNGLFTKHLVHHLATPGIDINLLFRRVCKGVWEESDEKQEPWYSEALKVDHYSLFE